MVEHNHDSHDSTVRERTEIRETRTGSSGTGLAFIVGGLVVAVGLIAWLLFGGMGDHTSGKMGPDGGGKSSSSVSVNVGGSGGSGSTKPAAGSAAKAGASSGGGAQAGASAGGSGAQAGASSSTGSN
ncbi:hypothetical protein U879_12230 [Defluviimonas sp. 20V17]|uniref:Uncharacterized protein n=1 Tax=Allgaiera indica TaxID=765699 RepID=A0AAN4ZYL7_9RHOB|nr:hypothetical protein [Allgaiera indica]KDB03430.1 hypothetical protein U879_12230 [Defluviimonas sp. 20V17]GHE00351.1 hypothetical protein GCM10008024_11510 [Allgaiera indica]SDW63239.1 hypothetical protein SAMN05444006_105162 [Allgaiera indica]